MCAGCQRVVGRDSGGMQAAWGCCDSEVGAVQSAWARWRLEVARCRLPQHTSAQNRLNAVCRGAWFCKISSQHLFFQDVGGWSRLGRNPGASRERSSPGHPAASDSRTAGFTRSGEGDVEPRSGGTGGGLILCTVKTASFNRVGNAPRGCVETASHVARRAGRCPRG